MTPDEKKQNPFLAKILDLMASAFNSARSDNEKLTSIAALIKHLKKENKDVYYLIERIEGFTKEEVQQAAQYGYRQGWAAAGQRHAAKPAPDSTGVNGHSWKAILDHCVRRSHALGNAYEKKYVKELARLLPMQGGDFKPRQAEKLRGIFIERFGGKI